MGEVKKTVEFYPAYHKIHSEPSKNYGVGALTCRFILVKDNKAVHLYFSTGVYLPETYKFWDGKNLHQDINKTEYRGYDLGFHSPMPREYQKDSLPHKDCPYIGQDCYSDGSASNSDEGVEILLRGGSKAVWEYLEKYWNSEFNNGEE